MAEAAAKNDECFSDTQHGKFLTFLLDKEAFGIEIECVTEIVGLQKISPLPESSAYVKGIVNLRGSIIPVIDMRLRLKKEAVPYTDRTCIIVVMISGIPVGLIVDSVDEVLYIDDQNIVPPPDSRFGYQSKYIKGIGKSGGNIRLLLDCEKMFHNEELESFVKISKQ